MASTMSASQLKATRGDSNTKKTFQVSKSTRGLIKAMSKDREYVTSSDGDLFNALTSEYYDKFASVHGNEEAESLNRAFLGAFSVIDKDYDGGWVGGSEGGAPDCAIIDSLFYPDIVSAGKADSRAWSKTFVSRTLVGDPGTTYKYLGLRIFAHPWSVDDVETVEKEKRLRALLAASSPPPSLPKEDEWLEEIKASTSPFISAKSSPLSTSFYYPPSTASALTSIKDANSALVTSSKKQLKKKVVGKNGISKDMLGSSQFTLTLINRMEPTAVRRDLKPDSTTSTLSGNRIDSKTSVSWHTDSGLVDYSTIAIWHHHKPPENLSKKARGDISNLWRVALRPIPSLLPSDAKIPALLAPLPANGGIYYMLDDLNHKFEHAVLAGGEGTRYSSTHRVARGGKGTYQFLLNELLAVLSGEHVFSSFSAPKEKKNDEMKRVKGLRRLLSLINEIEFEWIRQWRVQGEGNAKRNRYWLTKFALITSAQNVLLRIRDDMKTWLMSGCNGREGFEDYYDILIEHWESRVKVADSWKKRLEERVYASLPTIEQPVSWGSSDDLSAEAVEKKSRKARKWRSEYVDGSLRNKKRKLDGEEHGGGKKKKKDDKGKKKKKKKKDKSGGLTKKEQKGLGGNWALLKGSM